MAMVRVNALAGGEQAGEVGMVLRGLVEQAGELFGDPAAVLRVLDRVRRPHSDVARVRVGTGERSITVFVKVARLPHDGREGVDAVRARVERDYSVTARLYQSMPRTSGLTVVRPVACFPEHLALVTEEARGDTLLQFVESELRWVWRRADWSRGEHVCSRVGAWIRSFQQAIPGHGEVLVEDIIEYIDVRLRRLADHAAAAFSHDDRSAVLAAISRLTARVPRPVHAVPIHGDLALGNILVDGDTVTVLDLAMTTHGTVFYDLAHLHMQIGLLRLKPQFPSAGVRAMQRGLRAGYGHRDLETEPLFRLMLVQHVICHYLGLVERPAGRLSRMYNAWVAHHHLAWIRRFVGEA